jgi:hypothetical protein
LYEQRLYCFNIKAPTRTLLGAQGAVALTPLNSGANSASSMAGMITVDITTKNGTARQAAFCSAVSSRTDFDIASPAIGFGLKATRLTFFYAKV